MTEKIKSDELIPAGAGRIRELEVENENLKRENKTLKAQRPAPKRFITTSMIEAPPMVSPGKNIMVSTTIQKPHPIGARMLQTHGLNLPEPDAAEILDRVKKDRAADVTKKEKTK
jgi:hypothetical protein